MGKRNTTKKAAALERLPGHKEATSFFFALQGWREAAHIVLTAISTVCFTLAGIIGFKQTGPFWLNAGLYWALGGIAVVGILVWGEIRFFKPSYGELVRDRDLKITELETQTTTFEKVQEENQRLLQEAWNAHRGDLQMVLDSLATQLLEYICEGATDCRISAYSVEGNEFLLLSRCSRNPILEKRGRAAYPLTGGNIGQAWAKEWAFQDHESTDRVEWEEALVDASLFSKETASALTMQSQSIYAQRIDRGPDKIGMLVLECENPGKFNGTTLELVQGSLLMKAIAEILWSTHMHFPRVMERQEELIDSEKRTVVVPEPEWKKARPILRDAMVESNGSFDGQELIAPTAVDITFEAVKAPRGKTHINDKPDQAYASTNEGGGASPAESGTTAG